MGTLFKMGILLGVLSVCLSISYYFVIYVPGLEKKREKLYKECIANSILNFKTSAQLCYDVHPNVTGPGLESEMLTKCLEEPIREAEKRKDDCRKFYGRIQQP